MAENLNFTADGDYYVSDIITGGDNACVSFQLQFERAGASVIVEYALEPLMGWQAASRRTAGTTHADIVSGAIGGISVRIRTDREPVNAIYEQN